MKNGQIDTLFETNEDTENEQITKKIQKGIRNNIYKRSVMVVLAALVLIVFIIWLPVITGFGTTRDMVHILEIIPSWYFG